MSPRRRADPVFAAQLAVAKAAVAAFPGATTRELSGHIPADATGGPEDLRLLAAPDLEAAPTPARMMELLRALERDGVIVCDRPREERAPWRWSPAPPPAPRVAAPEEDVPWPEERR